jgi:hypothetical protein
MAANASAVIAMRITAVGVWRGRDRNADHFGALRPLVLAALPLPSMLVKTPLDPCLAALEGNSGHVRSRFPASWAGLPNVVGIVEGRRQKGL